MEELLSCAMLMTRRWTHLSGNSCNLKSAKRQIRGDMMAKKNEIVTVKVTDMAISGEGIGKVDGYTLFIKDTVIGDVAKVKITKVKKQYGYARLMELLEASSDRATPVCSVARQCGGCQIQALSYEKQLEFKQKKVRGSLIRVGGFDHEFVDGVMEPIIGMEAPFHYRNKAQYPVGTDKEGNLCAGFYAGRTHQIIPNLDCALGPEANRTILEKILEFMKEYHIPAYDEAAGKGLVRHVLIRCGFASGEIMVCLVLNGKKLPHSNALVEALRSIPGMESITYSVNRENTNVIMGNEICLLWGKEYITDQIGSVKYQISPLSFYQVNPVQTEALYRQALEYARLTGQETVWDLYCGIGTISLFLAKNAAKVYGVEIVPQAIEDARKNAQINGIRNAEFFVGRAEDILPEYYDRYEREHPGERVHADVIVVDPPRKGCAQSVLDTMVKMQPERIVYVSCDPATLARDLKYLCGRGYEVEKVRAVDMFPETIHVETIVSIQKKNS